MACDWCPFRGCDGCGFQGVPDWSAAFERAGWPTLTPETLKELRNEDE